MLHSKEGGRKVPLFVLGEIMDAFNDMIEAAQWLMNCNAHFCTVYIKINNEVYCWEWNNGAFNIINTLSY